MRKFKEKEVMVMNMKNSILKPLFVLIILLTALFVASCTDEQIDAPLGFENLSLTLSFKNNRLYSGYLLETVVKDEEQIVAKLTKSLCFNKDVFKLTETSEKLSFIDGDEEMVSTEQLEYYTLSEHYYQEEGNWVKEEGNYQINGEFLISVQEAMFKEGYQFTRMNNLAVFTGELKESSVDKFIPGIEFNGTFPQVEIKYNSNARQLQKLTLSYYNETNKQVTITLEISYKIHNLVLPLV